MEDPRTNTVPPEEPAQAGHVSPRDHAVSDPALPAEQGQSPETDSPKTDFMRWAAERTDKQWKLYQLGGGVLLGSVAGVLITVFSGMESIGMFALLGAVFCALFLPQYFARQADRAIPLLRIALIITLALWMGASLVSLLITGVPLFQK